jgi:hypothetical protein
MDYIEEEGKVMDIKQRQATIDGSSLVKGGGRHS